jgi:hypothetical protein
MDGLLLERIEQAGGLLHDCTSAQNRGFLNLGATAASDILAVNSKLVAVL